MATSSREHPALPRLNLPLPIQIILIHLLAWVITFALTQSSLAAPSNWTWLVITQGLMAAALTYLLQLPAWWLMINLVFFPLAGLVQTFNLDSGWYLLGLVILLLTQFGALRSRVPLYLSSRQAKTALVQVLPDAKGLKLLDIGSGMGSLLAHLASARPDIKLDGIESAPLLWLVSRLRLNNKAKIHFADLWSHDLSGYDVVYAFLSPEPMARLWHKAKSEMKSGSLFISNTFEIPGILPDRVIELHDLNRGRLLIWRIS